MAITKITITLPKSKTELVREALNFYKTSITNMGMSGKKLNQKVEELDDLIVLSGSEIIVQVHKHEYDNFKKMYGRDFPTLEE